MSNKRKVTTDIKVHNNDMENLKIPSMIPSMIPPKSPPKIPPKSKVLFSQ